jgi:hypothetical protein
VIGSLGEQLPFTSVFERAAGDGSFAPSRPTEREVIQRFAVRRLGLDGRVATDLAALIPPELARRARNPQIAFTTVAVSLPAAVQYFPPAALPLNRTQRLLDHLCPVLIAGRRHRPASKREAADSGRKILVRGADGGLGGHLQARLPSLTKVSGRREVLAALGSRDVDLAFITAHVITTDTHPLHAPERAESISAHAIDLGGGETITQDDIAHLSRVPWCVVLAGCRTGGAMPWMSDERVGLASSFLRAGARWVIGALWPIQSHHHAFLRELYQALQGPESPPAALRRVQLGFIRKHEAAVAAGRQPGSTFEWLPWACFAATD